MKVQDCFKEPVYSVSSIGQALTNRCGMNCPHCYSRPYTKDIVSIEDCSLVLRAFPNVKEINFGTGETYLNQKFLEIFNLYKQKGIRLALTTNGNTLNAMTDKEITSFLSDVDVSLDFPNAVLHDSWRVKGAFVNAISGIERCKKLGVKVSIALALTNKNYRHLLGFTRILDEYGVVLRINIYKPVHDVSLELSYDQFWEAIWLMSENFSVVGNSEPLLSLFLNNSQAGSPCSHSFRIHTDLSVSGCVYLSNELIETKEFIELSKKIPTACSGCKVVEICRGGCLSRRILQSSYFNPDVYCPLVRGKRMPDIKFRQGPQEDLVHLNYLCTILLSRRFI